VPHRPTVAKILPLWSRQVIEAPDPPGLQYPFGVWLYAAAPEALPDLIHGCCDGLAEEDAAREAGHLKQVRGQVLILRGRREVETPGVRGRYLTQAAVTASVKAVSPLFKVDPMRAARVGSD
jgi:hypothetical protein